MGGGKNRANWAPPGNGQFPPAGTVKAAFSTTLVTLCTIALLESVSTIACACGNSTSRAKAATAKAVAAQRRFGGWHPGGSTGRRGAFRGTSRSVATGRSSYPAGTSFPQREASDSQVLGAVSPAPIAIPRARWWCGGTRRWSRRRRAAATHRRPATSLDGVDVKTIDK